MTNYLNTQVDSAIANLLVPPTDTDPDYNAYIPSYASVGIIKPVPNAERRVFVKLQLGITSKPANQERGVPLLQSVKTSSTTSIATGSGFRSSVSQKGLLASEELRLLLSDSIPKSAQVDSKTEVQPPSTETSQSQLQTTRECECAGECRDADWC